MGLRRRREQRLPLLQGDQQQACLGGHQCFPRLPQPGGDQGHRVQPRTRDDDNVMFRARTELPRGRARARRVRERRGGGGLHARPDVVRRPQRQLAPALPRHRGDQDR